MRLTTWRILTLAMVVTTLGPVAAEAQTYTPPQAGRQFISVAYNWLYTWPQRLADHPLEDLLGTPVDEAEPPHDYRTRDGSTVIDLLEFNRRGQGASVTVYPIGMSVGPTLGVRGSVENLPDIRFAFDGPGALDSYALTNAIAYDVGAGVYVADRAPGWGLGSLRVHTRRRGQDYERHRCGQTLLRRGRRWHSVRPAGIRDLGQVRLEPAQRTSRTQLLFSPHQPARNGELLMSAVD